MNVYGTNGYDRLSPKQLRVCWRRSAGLAAAGVMESGASCIQAP